MSAPPSRAPPGPGHAPRARQRMACAPQRDSRSDRRCGCVQPAPGVVSTARPAASVAFTSNALANGIRSPTTSLARYRPTCVPGGNRSALSTVIVRNSGASAMRAVSPATRTAPRRSCWPPTALPGPARAVRHRNVASTASPALLAHDPPALLRAETCRNRDATPVMRPHIAAMPPWARRPQPGL
jgi:hypothetical protein